MTSLVGVHGIFNYRAGHAPESIADHLAQKWRSALVAGPLAGALDHTEISVAYYASHLRRSGAQGVGESLDDLSPAAEAMLRSWLSIVETEPGPAQGPGTKPLRQAIARFASSRGLPAAAVERFVAVFFREVDHYLHWPDARSSARATVAEAIHKATGRRIVMAHSLGSVVAYEALWDNPDIVVDMFVTLGSPLALPHTIFPNLQPSPVHGRGRKPPNVRRWVNLADVGDLIAIPRRGISSHFTDVAPADDIEATIHAFDFHLVANYLGCPRLAEIVRPILEEGGSEVTVHNRPNLE